MITWAQLGLQDASSPIIEEFLFFHDFAILVLIFIIRAVGLVIGGVLTAPYVDLGLLEGQIIECIWTLVPAIILVQIAIPSLLLLYILDERVNDRITIKAIGHQWYWRYEYSDYWTERNGLEFDSYMKKGDSFPRLLDVDSRLVLPYSTHIRVLVTATDVLHSWALPSLGVKADACPGRLNQIKLLRHRGGVFFGQCSEICGANHSFMPIAVEFVNANDYINWVKASLE